MAANDDAPVSDIATRPDGPSQTGESGGGPYPAPDSDGAQRSGASIGGAEYFGHGQLGAKDVGDNDNAVAERD
jgi:hypothetical protein